MANSDILAQNPEEQCQSSDERGNLCRLKRTPTSIYCAKHGGVPNQRELMRNYKLTQFKARVNDKLQSDTLLSLREEIGISRLTLEEILNSCQGSVDLLMYQPKIVGMVTTIQKCVEACQKLEERTNNLLSKTVLLQFADEVVSLIGQYIPDADVRATLAGQLLRKLEALEQAKD